MSVRVVLDRIALPLVLAAAAMLISDRLTSPTSDAAALSTLPIQDGGRIRPLDTAARQLAFRVAGPRPFESDAVMGLEPAVWFVSMMADPDRWRYAPMIRVSDAAVRARLRLDSRTDRYSYNELVERVRVAPTADGSLEATLMRLHGVLTLEEVRVVPHPNGARDVWMSLRELDGAADEGLAAVRESWEALFQAVRDNHATSEAAAMVARQLARAAPSGIAPATSLLRLEARDNRTKPFRIAWLCYLAALIAVLLANDLSRTLTGKVGMILAAAGIAVHSSGIVVRVLIAGRPPVTNMFESVVWAGWGAVALTLTLGRGARPFVGSGVAVALCALLVAEAPPIYDASIDPLLPVLRDNVWLTVHVLTISLANAAFALAAVLAHVQLATYMLGSRSSGSPTVPASIYRCLQIGLLLGVAGAAMGGWWASYAWGRFWGWDAKETSVFVTLMFYLATLHSRVGGWLGDLGTATASVVGFLGVLWSWYGVNFVLRTGLHSYGFGSGGYRVVAAVAIAELMLVAAAAAQRLRRTRIARVNALPSVTASAVSPVSDRRLAWRPEDGARASRRRSVPFER